EHHHPRRSSFKTPNAMSNSGHHVLNMFNCNNPTLTSKKTVPNNSKKTPTNKPPPIQPLACRDRIVHTSILDNLWITSIRVNTLSVNGGCLPVYVVAGFSPR